MQIHRVQGVMAASYLIESGGGLFLVDAGFVGTEHLVLRAIRRIGRRAEDLRLALITHPHLDHFGGLAALRARHEFAIGAHPQAARAIAEGGKEYSPGLTPFTRWVNWLAKTSLPHLNFRGAGPVLWLDDGFALHELGLPGRIVHTPGHTQSCLSLVLDDGSAFTGDLAQGTLPLSDQPRPPSMAWSLDAALGSWQQLLDAGVERFFPAHGGAFVAGALADTLARTESALASV